ncbi:hypothetical protein J437_LFUL000132 [Ladona fulva]|uniref:NFACT protein C-terminal domain-containing protein n=1 Tax=Ladona fulva TaxID=123851 RepID=A0A8K0K4D7_LADFU|nr:hypothetical protein J437_LFUL000132 [Ladona fulva]
MEDDESLSRLTITESVEGSISGTDGASQSLASTELEEDQEIELEDSEDEEVEKKSNDQNESTLKEDEAEDDANKNDVSDDDSEDDKMPKFPDTQIKLEHQHGQLSVVAESASILKNPKSTEDDSVIYLGDNKPVKIKPADNNKKRQQKKEVEKNKGQAKGHKQKGDKKKGAEADSDTENETKNEQQVKRGQRGKLKKIKEKYKDQDEEERKLRMEILQSAGSAKDSKGKKGKQDQGNNKKKNAKKNEKKISLTPFSGTGYLLGDDQDVPDTKVVAKEEQGGEEEEDDEEGPTGGETDVLFTLTGQPVPEDELLFAIPTVAPYNALANYKFKVKLTPGTGKRGKAAKTALNMFMREKTTTPRERDLLRSVKDQDIARNIPGKVKVSAPMLQKLKK